MQAARLTTAVVVCLALVGCRTNRAQELLERELRHQEDHIYHLEDKLKSAEEMIAALEQQHDGHAHGTTSGATSTDRPSSSRTRLWGTESTPRTTEPRGSELPNEELRPPQIKLEGAEQAPPFRGLPEYAPPDPSRPEGENPGPAMPLRIPALPTATGDAKSAEAPSDSSTATDTELTDLQVAQITLNPELTGPWNADGVAAVDGVRVVIEPRASGGQIVPVPGKVSIVLMDPALEGSAARVARWDFSLPDSADHFGRVPSGGMQFELRWPQRPPSSAIVSLHVRYTTSDGRKLDAELPLNLAGGPIPKTAELGTPMRVSSPSPSMPGPRGSWTRSKQPAPRPLTPRIVTEPVIPHDTTSSDAAPRATIRDARVPDDRSPQREASVPPTEPRAARRPEWAPYR